jgi:hypothetical protein
LKTHIPYPNYAGALVTAGGVVFTAITDGTVMALGNPSAQPDQRFAFPSAQAGANDQTFRLIVRPDIWGRQARQRLTNMFGTKVVTFDGVFVGLQMGGPGLVKGTNRVVTFGGKDTVSVAPGSSVWSDPVALTFVRNSAAAELAGRKLAVSFHVNGESGPMTWHAKALTTSYVTAPGAGSKGKSDDESAFPYRGARIFVVAASGADCRFLLLLVSPAAACCAGPMAVSLSSPRDRGIECRKFDTSPDRGFFTHRIPFADRAAD